MTPNYLRMMARYNAWAHGRVHAACRKLRRDDYFARHGTFFDGLHGTLNHILVADRVWIGRLTGDLPPIASLDQILCLDLESMIEARAEEDRRIAEMVDSMDDAEAARIVTYRPLTGDGSESRTPVGLIFAHMFNHATHHRGHAHAILTRIPAEAPPLDLIYFLREQPQWMAIEG